MTDLFPDAGTMVREADISPCGQYRWTLRRRWADGPSALWIMLNPSTADAERDDPTLLRVIHFSRSWGYGSATVVNLYPFRSSSPGECRRWAHWEANGPDWYARDAHIHNESVIERECRRPGMGLVVAAWGAGIWDIDYADHVLANSIECVPDIKLYCLGTTADGSPKHPMARGVHRVPDDQQPILWRTA